MRNNILIGIITLFCFSLFANPPKPVKNKNQQFKNKEIKKKESKKPSLTAIEIFEDIKNIPFKELESYLNGSRILSPFDNIDYLQKTNNIKDFCHYRRGILYITVNGMFYYVNERNKLISNTPNNVVPNDIGIHDQERWNTELLYVIAKLERLYKYLQDVDLPQRALKLGWKENNRYPTLGKGHDLDEYCDLLLKN